MERLARYARAALEFVMIPGFSRLSVHGYRRLKAVDIPLRRLNVLIGANGVGKTSILQVFRLLSVSADRKLVAAVLEAGGLGSILTADGSTSALEFQIQFQSEAEGEITYELGLTEQGVLPTLSISNERLCQNQAGGPRHPVVLIETQAAWPDYHEPNETLLTGPTYDRSTHDRSETALRNLHRLPGRSRFVKSLAASPQHITVSMCPSVLR